MAGKERSVRADHSDPYGHLSKLRLLPETSVVREWKRRNVF